MFPSSLLAKLFVKGTLKNTENGFEFKLKNIIDNGTLIGLGSLNVDAATYLPSAMIIKVGEKERRGDAISRTEPLPVRAFSEIHIRVEGAPLEAGTHKILVLIYTREVGRLQFTVDEPVNS